MTTATKVRSEDLPGEVTRLETAAVEVATEAESATMKAAEAERRLDQLLADGRSGKEIKEAELSRARAVTQRAQQAVRDAEAAGRAIRQRLMDARTRLAKQQAAGLRSHAEAIAKEIERAVTSFAEQELAARQSLDRIRGLAGRLTEAAAACRERLDLGDFGGNLRQAFSDPEHSPSHPALAMLRTCLRSLDEQLRSTAAQRRAA